MKEVLTVLERALASEHLGIAQYMAHHYTFSQMGLKKLADLSKRESIEEMKHAEDIAERLTFLGVDPPYRLLGAPLIEGNVKELLASDMHLEEDAIQQLNSGISVCRKYKDAISASLLERILADEEKHLFELRTILSHINKFADHYLVKMI